MDHIFEQKLVRDNQHLNNQVFKLNNQVKELKEKVLIYESILSQLDESHTLEQLKKLDKGELNKLKTKYGKELSNIHSILKKK